MICPLCKGEGGEFEAVLWYGIGGGPYYECSYCSGQGTVSFFRFVYWWYMIIIDKILSKFQKR